MKQVLIAATFAALALTACSSNKEKAPETANLTVEQALQECQQTVGNTQDNAALDACMKDKGFERPAAAAAAPAEAAPAAPAAPEAAMEPAAPEAPAAKTGKTGKAVKSGKSVKSGKAVK